MNVKQQNNNVKMFKYNRQLDKNNCINLFI